MRRPLPALSLVFLFLVSAASFAAQQTAKKPAAKPAAQQPPDTGEVVAVPPGPFKMGCTLRNDVPWCDDDERCARDAKENYCAITLSAFSIDKTEVTQRAYQACIKAGKCTPPETGFDPANKADHPVVNVTWEQANTFCAWAGKRLPTEAEWEKAGRGDDWRKFPWGNEDPTCDRAQYLGCALPGTHPVGSHPAGASPYGALDVAGNVYEWVNDWYGGYVAGPKTDPQGPDESLGDTKVVRGGAFDGEGIYTRAANRGNRFYKKALPNVGFRCAK